MNKMLRTLMFGVLCCVGGSVKGMLISANPDPEGPDTVYGLLPYYETADGELKVLLGKYKYDSPEFLYSAAFEYEQDSDIVDLLQQAEVPFSKEKIAFSLSYKIGQQGRSYILYAQEVTPEQAGNLVQLGGAAFIQERFSLNSIEPIALSEFADTRAMEKAKGAYFEIKEQGKVGVKFNLAGGFQQAFFKYKRQKTAFPTAKKEISSALTGLATSLANLKDAIEGEIKPID